MNKEQKDQHLLKMAALAYGIVGDYQTTVTNNFDECGIRKVWNPLIDEGDALRLSTKLKLEIYHAWDEVDTVYVGYRFTEDYRVRTLYIIETYEQSSVDSATKRAIVRAAAAIGEKMCSGWSYK